eukprot:56092-Amphidinium_carterae.1
MELEDAEPYRDTKSTMSAHGTGVLGVLGHMKDMYSQRELDQIKAEIRRIESRNRAQKLRVEVWLP